MTASPGPPTVHECDGVDVLLRRAGRGEPLLVLHGGAGPDSTTPILDRYAVTHDVLAPTHPGWDGTARPDRLDSVGALADLYLHLLADLDLRDVTVLGSSFGGWIAAEMGVRDNAPRLGRLMLFDAAGPSAEGHRPDPGSDAQLERALPEGARIGLDLLQAYTGPSMQDPTLLRRLAAVAVPVLVVWGEQDPVLPTSFGRVYADAFPDARFEVIRDAGHLPTTEAPEATFALVDDFLHRHDTPDGHEDLT